MKLNIRFGYLYIFNNLLRSDDYLQEVLTKESSMIYKIEEGADIEYIEKELNKKSINFVIA